MAAIKEDLHKLIDTTNDEKLLEDIFMILSSRRNYKEGSLWASLTEAQKQDVLASESEISDESAWLTQEEIKRRNSKWLR
ncbi:hypothetical protein [Pontibacter virosus]|uniref:Uncharacterized protein n=1 Tax=Pontibacter virosus TaxID=1765052 RepID=A0A2U1ANL0_9BACT|nr:hypothetical protein [Pontibacter virosus]PVY37907.1 hypothetical protein C8E01_1209 [Pontibacter virosus]